MAISSIYMSARATLASKMARAKVPENTYFKKLPLLRHRPVSTYLVLLDCNFDNSKIISRCYTLASKQDLAGKYVRCYHTYVSTISAYIRYISVQLSKINEATRC